MKTAAQLSPVPIAMHLDHGEDFETAVKCIDAGFSSVMIDGSFLSFDENVAVTKRVVSVAHAKGVSVEAELGKLAGVEERSVAEKDAILTDPESAVEFVEKTGLTLWLWRLALRMARTNSKAKLNLTWKGSK